MTEHKQIFFPEDVGKPVFSLISGKGEIINYYKNKDYPVEVVFSSDDTKNETYTNSGYEWGIYKTRTLFHGHNIKITGEEIPARKMWLNVWANADMNTGSYLCDSKGVALKLSSDKAHNYIIRAMEVEIDDYYKKM